MLSLFVLALYLFIAALASSPVLHHFFHHDANSPDHQCAATIIASGQVDVPLVAVAPAAAPALVILPAQCSEPLPLAALDFWLLPERAPPVSLS